MATPTSSSDVTPSPGDDPKRRPPSPGNLADTGFGEVPGDGTFGEGPSFGTSASLGGAWTGGAGGPPGGGTRFGRPAYDCEKDGPLEPDEFEWPASFMLGDPRCRKCGGPVRQR